MTRSSAILFTRRKLFAMSLFSSIAALFGRVNAQEQRFPDIATFRDRVIAALQREPGIVSAAPHASDPAKIDVKLGDLSVSSDVTNIFGYLNSYPDEDADEIIGRFVRAALGANTAEVNESNLVAMIRTPASIEAMKASGANVAYEPLIGELIVVYMADRPDSLTTATLDQFPGKSLADLRSIAAGNLRRWLQEVIGQGEASSFVLYNVKGNEILVTGLILLDDFWNKIKPDFPGDVLVAIPRRDQLFIFDAANPNAAGEARRLIDATFEDNFNLLSEHIYQRRNGKLEVFAE